MNRPYIQGDACSRFNPVDEENSEEDCETHCGKEIEDSDHSETTKSSRIAEVGDPHNHGDDDEGDNECLQSVEEEFAEDGEEKGFRTKDPSEEASQNNASEDSPEKNLLIVEETHDVPKQL